MNLRAAAVGFNTMTREESCNSARPLNVSFAFMNAEASAPVSTIGEMSRNASASTSVSTMFCPEIAP